MAADALPDIFEADAEAVVFVLDEVGAAEDAAAPSSAALATAPIGSSIATDATAPMPSFHSLLECAGVPVLMVEPSFRCSLRSHGVGRIRRPMPSWDAAGSSFLAFSPNGSVTVDSNELYRTNNQTTPPMLSPPPDGDCEWFEMNGYDFVFTPFRHILPTTTT
ncbi:hypothetical protein [Bifidobacterium simiarum]|uniref:hypothetical protein n=1 Tax=Bifidobacterium simiarum TaxID=2045441 RepID=UPI001FAEAEB0|nr:hypothetical protein [Bifidobacterium simiarum]